MEHFGDLSLANQIERVSAEDDAAYVCAMRDLYPKNNWDVISFDTGMACFVGNSPFTNCHGFGTKSSSDQLQSIEAIEKFFASKDCPTILSVASVVDYPTIKFLYERGYKTSGCRNTHIFQAACIVDHRPINPAIRIVECFSEKEMELWLKTVSEGFAGKNLDGPDEISRGQAVKQGNRFFLAYLDDQVAAASALYINKKVARLGGMGTLVDYRANGIQTAMVRHRIRIAQEACCDVIFSDTQPGSDSQRNLERQGLKIAYVRLNMRK